MRVWECKIGRTDDTEIREGGDKPMREAVLKAYKELTGEEPEFIFFSGWGAKLTTDEPNVL